MIFDAIASLIGSLIAAMVEGLALAFVPLLNLALAGIEAIVGIFVSGFSLRRIDRKKPESGKSAIPGILSLVCIIALLGWWFVLPAIMKRDITLIAEDGHSLPFAAVIVHTGDEQAHRRSNNAGRVTIPRFATTALTIKDPRYVEQTWPKEEIGSKLVVQRTVLGAGLDKLADRLLKPDRRPRRNEER